LIEKGTIIMNEPANPELTLEKVYEALKNCFDPEIPINIVDLGLVYDVQIVEGNKVVVKMSLTTQGCGMGPSIALDAKMKILGLPGVLDATVDIIWDPPWGQHMISEAGRKKLGMA
jgi:metal-sulfur cluster biosynthetic enzyme